MGLILYLIVTALTATFIYIWFFEKEANEDKEVKYLLMLLACAIGSLWPVLFIAGICYLFGKRLLKTPIDVIRKLRDIDEEE